MTRKICLSCSISQEPYILWLSFVLHKCIMSTSCGIFSIFPKFWFSRLVGKGEKIAQNDKKCCLLHLISQELYITWPSLVVHKCKMVISPGIFLLYSKFWFFGLLGGSKGEKWPKMTKNLACCTLYLRISPKLYIIWSSFMVQICKRISPGVFSTFFPNFNFWGLVKGEKWPKMTKNYVSHISYLRKHAYDRDFWYTSVKWWHL